MRHSVQQTVANTIVDLPSAPLIVNYGGPPMSTKETCILLFGLCVLSWGCSCSGLRTQYTEGQMIFGTPPREVPPRLVLTSYPRVGYAGVTITFHVTLENVPVSDN